jgi:hypothetical protein
VPCASRRLTRAPSVAQVRETVRAVKFLHNTNFFAAAQEKCARCEAACV